MPDAIPARSTGTEPVSECDAGVPAKPTPMPMNAYPRPTFQYAMSSFQRISMVRKPRKQKTYPVSSVNRDPLRGDQLRRAGCDEHHHHRRGEDGEPGVEGVE